MANSQFDWSRRSIDNPSQELFLEAFKSVPIEPCYSTLVFNADGVKNQDYWNWSTDDKKYLEECDNKGIIPFSFVRFEWDFNEGLFKPRAFLSDSILTNSSPEGIKGLIKGGRVHKIMFTNGYREAVNDQLPFLLEQNYKINSGDIALSLYHLTGYNQGYYPDTQIIFDLENHRNGLELKMGSNISQEDELKVKSWFNRLYNKYQLKQMTLVNS